MTWLDGIGLAAAILYAAATTFLALQGLHSLWLLGLFRRADCQRRSTGRESPTTFRGDAPGRSTHPAVLVQLPIYNERDVIARLVAAAGAMRWPADRLRIQILDDSSDDTAELAAAATARLVAAGIDARHVRRGDRTGFKAGALAHGLALDAAHPDGAAPFIAIFDADFVPPTDFLLKAIPHFDGGERIAFVQGRWEHLNPHQNLLTRAQALGIDGHFAIEQGARAWSGLALNFNGTCGVWRRAAIDDSGGWQHDTLTEDLDLSYRAHLRGWRAIYDLDLAVPGELPPTLEAWRAQQFRWAKGSLQTARKLLPSVWRSDWTKTQKLAATCHLTHYLVHPAMVASMVLAPFATLALRHVPMLAAILGAIVLLSGLVPPLLLYVAAQRRLGRPRRDLVALPALMSYGTGIALANSVAAWQALRGRASAFLRTPKSGSGTGSYRAAPATGLGELAISGVASFGLLGIWSSRSPWLAPIVALYVLGFLGQGLHLLLARVLERVRDRGSSRRSAPLLGAAALAVVAMMWLASAARDGTWRNAPWSFAGGGLTLGLACAIATYRARRTPVTRTDLAVILVTTVAIHALACRLPLSDDVHRYAVEGAQLVAGENPYSVPPAQTSVTAAAALAGSVNHAAMTSIYPPLALAAHALVMQAFGGLPGFRALAVLATIALLGGLLVALISARRSPTLVVVAAWNPVLVLFGTGEAHHDLLAAVALLATCFALANHRVRAAILLASAAALLKPFALAVLPVLFVASSWRHVWIPLAVAAAAYAPFLAAGHGLVASLIAFGRDMQFHGALEPFVRSLLLDWLQLPVGSLSVRVTLGSMLVTGFVWLLWRSRDESLPSRMARALGLLLLCLPTLHPWYFTLLVVLLPFTRSRALLAWTLAAPLYWLHGTAIGGGGGFAEWPMATTIAHVPFLLWMLGEAFGPWRAPEAHAVVSQPNPSGA